MGNDGNETPFVPTVRNVPIVLFVPAVPTVRNVPFVLFVPYRKNVPFVPIVPFVSGVPGPLRHSPLARPVPPLPHAGEANVTYRSCLPRLRGRWPAGPERATFTGLRSKNRAPQPWPAGPERAKPPSFWTGAQGLHQGCAGAAGRLTAGCGTARRSPPRWCRGGCRDGRRRRKRFQPGRGCPPP